MSDEIDEINDPNHDSEYQAAFLELTKNVATVIRDHMKDPPYSRDKIYQVLNALASQAANVLVACNDEIAADFFMDCLTGNMKHIRENHPEIAKGGVSG